MYKMRIILLVFFCFFNSFAQEFSNKQLDSLKNILKNKNIDFKEQVEVLNKLSRYIGKSDIVEGMSLNNKMLKISIEHNYFRGYGYYYQNLSNKYVYQGDFISAEKYADKASKVFKVLKDNNNYIASVYNLCFAKDMQGTQQKYDEAEKLAKETIVEYEFKKNTDKIGVLYFYLSVSYNNENKPKLVFFYLNKAIDLYRKNKDILGEFDCNRQLAYICMINDMNEKSIFLLNQFPINSIFFVKLGIQNKLRTHELYFTNYIKLKQYSKALTHCKLFMSIADKAKIDYEIEIANIFFAEIYTNLKQYKKAMIYLNKLDKKKHDEWGSFQINKIKTQLFFQIGKYDESLKFAKLNYLLNPKDIDNLKLLADIEKEKGNYKNSYFYLQSHLEFKVKKLINEKDSQIYDYEALYQLKDKELALQKSKLKIEKNEEALKKQKEYILFLSLLSASLIFIFILLFHNHKNKQKSNKILANKNKELEIINELLNKSLHEKQILLKEIHHRVKNNLQLVMSLLNIQAQDTQNVSIKDFLEKGQSRIATMSLIHQNLYQTENFANINFQEYLENLVNNISQTFNAKNIDYVIKTNNNNFDLDTAIPLGLIINELVCNALKHAFPSNLKGKIEIEINKNPDGVYELEIGDNGVGVSNSETNGKSIGLELVSLLVMQLKGKIYELNKMGTNYKIVFDDSLNTI